MYKQYINKDAINCGLWSRWWEYVDNPTEMTAKSLEKSDVWRQMEPFLSKRGRILEAGCGLGQWVRFFEMQGFQEAIGLDNCEAAVEKAQCSYPKSKFLSGDICNMQFPDDYFDVIVSYGVLEHFEEGAAVPMVEHLRVLKPGGHLVITQPYHKRWDRMFGRFPEGGPKDDIQQ